MLFDNKVCVAFKNFDNQYIINEFSIFELNNINQNFTTIKLKMDSKNIFISVQCPVCGKEHVYKYSVSDFIKREVIVGGCENFGTPIFYIGNDKKVRLHVDKYNEVSLIAKLMTSI